MSFKPTHFYSFRNINVELFLSDNSHHIYLQQTRHAFPPHIDEAVSGDWVNG